MAKKLKVYNGSSWEDVTFAITPPSTDVTNAFTTNQVIDASTSVAALRITQRGTGEAFRVEDDTNPDSSPFVITADGLVGIGISDFSIRGSTNNAARVLMNGGIVISNYAETADSGITISRANGTAASPTQILANQRSAFFLGNTYGTSSFNNNIGLTFWASENQTDTARGSHMVFETTSLQSVGRAERMRIDASGNVGIGVSAPTFKLDVTGTIRATGAIQVDSTSDGSLFLNRAGAAWNYIAWSRDATRRAYLGISPDGLIMELGLESGTNRFVVTQAATTDRAVRNVYTSISAPSGGNDGDMWAVYV